MIILILSAAGFSCTGPAKDFIDEVTTVKAPQFSPESGIYSTDQNVTITTLTADATICYTEDGSTPACNSAKDACSTGTKYTAAIAVAGDGTSKSFKAMACKSSMEDSTVVSAAITIDYEAVFTPQFSVGGRVYGLNGTIILQNNGADSLTVTNDGPFTFPLELDDGSAYNVSITTQPMGYTCQTSINTGVIAGANVSDVTISCPWQTFLGQTLDSDGDPQWNNSMVAMDDGSFIIVGESKDDIPGALNPHSTTVSCDTCNDIYLVKVGSDGTRHWHTFFGQDNVTEMSWGIARTGDGGVVVSGLAEGSVGTPIHPYRGNLDILLVKFAANGSYLWHTYTGGLGDDTGKGIIETSDGGLLVTGHATDFGAVDGLSAPLNAHGGNEDVVLIKYDSAGNYLWHTFAGGGGNDSGWALVETGDGGYAVTGQSDATFGGPIAPKQGGERDVLIMKFNSAGDLLWHTFHGEMGQFDGGRRIIETRDGGLAIAGELRNFGGDVREGYGGGTGDLGLIKLDTDGNYQWHTYAGDVGWQGGFGLVETAEGVFVCVGMSESGFGTPLAPYTGGLDTLLVKFNSDGYYQWHTFAGSGSNENANAMVLVQDGSFVLTGYAQADYGTSINGFSGGGRNMVLMKVLADGSY